MRVLHVLPDISRAFGGPTQALLGYLAASRSAGIEASVVAPEPPEHDLEWFRGQAGDTRVEVYRAWGRGSARLAPGVLRRVSSQSVDVVHVHGLFNGVSTSAARRCRASGVPYVIRPFGTLSRYTFEHRRTLIKRAYFSLLDAPAIRSAGALHFTTAEERDDARRLAAVRNAPSAVIPPPWVDGDSMGRPRARHGSGESGGARPATILFLSRLHQKKGLESLIDAWPAVRAQRPDSRLIIAGSGAPDYERSVKARVVQSGNSDSVHFAGFVTGADKARWLAEADVFVLPSYHENFGVSVLEAVAAGVPAVVSPEVQLASVVKEHRLGAVVPREPAMLAAGILSVLADSALRQRVAVEGSGVVQSLFSPETIGLQLRAMYDVARSRSTT